MTSTTLLFSLALALAVLLAGATARTEFVLGAPASVGSDTLRTTSRKFQSVAGKRESLADDEFAFSFKKDGVRTNVGTIRAEIISPPRHRLFGFPDVNIVAVRVFQPSGAVIPWHTHPRASENYVTIGGTLRLQIKLEGVINVRNVTSMLPPGHVSSIPQGLPHTLKCVSKKTCEYHIFFNSADPGITPANESEM